MKVYHHENVSINGSNHRYERAAPEAIWEKVCTAWGAVPRKSDHNKGGVTLKI
jgi:hypothetical protein